MNKDNVVTLVSYKIRKGINHHNREIFDYMAELPEDEQLQAMMHFYDHLDHEALERQFGPFGANTTQPEDGGPVTPVPSKPGQGETTF